LAVVRLITSSYFVGASRRRADTAGREASALTEMLVSVDVFDVLRPAPNVLAAGHQAPLCLVSTHSPKQRHAQPKPPAVLAGTAQSGVLAWSLPNSISEMHASPPPVMSWYCQAW
jgi:hypothetical protein